MDMSDEEIRKKIRDMCAGESRMYGRLRKWADARVQGGTDQDIELLIMLAEDPCIEDATIGLNRLCEIGNEKVLKYLQYIYTPKKEVVFRGEIMITQRDRKKDGTVINTQHYKINRIERVTFPNAQGALAEELEYLDISPHFPLSKQRVIAQLPGPYKGPIYNHALHDYIKGEMARMQKKVGHQ